MGLPIYKWVYLCYSNTINRGDKAKPDRTLSHGAQPKGARQKALKLIHIAKRQGYLKDNRAYKDIAL